MEKPGTIRSEELGGNDIPLVKVENLRQHFKSMYQLADEQIDLMLESSARSLRATFAEMEEIFLGTKNYQKLARQAHSMKGVLLNMGEKEWAARAREIEVAALAAEEKDYRQLIDEIRMGVCEIVEM